MSYFNSSNSFQDLTGFATGLGGVIRFYHGKHFMWGSTGGTTKLTYNTNNSDLSHASIGFGGAFVGYYNFFSNNVRLNVAAFAGMGKYENLHVIDIDNNNRLDSYYYENATFILSPYISIDYFLTKKIAATVQFNCLFGKNISSEVFQIPGVQVGILFNR